MYFFKNSAQKLLGLESFSPFQLTIYILFTQIEYQN